MRTVDWIFGHAVEWDGPGFGDLRYVDNGEPVNDIGGPSMCRTSDRLCPRCGEAQTLLGHDPCIANLPGVAFACCGHGLEPGYILFKTGTRVTLEKLEAP